MQTKLNILIIKLGALGDLCLSMRYFERIREVHPHAHISLMTTAPFVPLCRNNPSFNEVLCIKRWGAMEIPGWISFISLMRKKKFSLVYDIQSNDRTNVMRNLSPAEARKNWITFWGPLSTQRALPFNGAVFDPGEALDLRPRDLSWLMTDISHYNINPPYALIVPGCAPQHLYKRWPARHFSEAAQILLGHGITPVLIGGKAEKTLISEIVAAAPGAINLAENTTYEDIASLAKTAAFAIGNDTGPMHLIALCDTKTLSLFSGKTDPARSAPRTPQARHLRKPNISDIAPNEVETAIADWLEGAK